MSEWSELQQSPITCYRQTIPPYSVLYPQSPHHRPIVTSCLMSAVPRSFFIFKLLNPLEWFVDDVSGFEYLETKIVFCGAQNE